MLTDIVQSVRRVCRTGGTILLALGVVLLLSDWREGHAYRTLSETHGPQGQDIGTDAAGSAPQDVSKPDWEALTTINPDICGWVCVRGTDIDLPVVSSASVPDGFYLAHDLWGNRSRTGVPHLDSRCDRLGIHRLVYGHHLATGGQFSALQKAYEPEVFEGIGTCLWFTPDGQTETFEPLCAIVVDEWFAPIQRFAFTGDSALRTWLASIAQQAQARSPHTDGLVMRANRVLTLVTCASELSGQPWRTLVVFASAGMSPDATDADIP